MKVEWMWRYVNVERQGQVGEEKDEFMDDCNLIQFYGNDCNVDVRLIKGDVKMENTHKIDGHMVRLGVMQKCRSFRNFMQKYDYFWKIIQKNSCFQGNNEKNSTISGKLRICLLQENDAKVWLF